MLAQYFQTPQKLGLSDRSYKAHIKVLGMLERGEMRHAAGPIPNGFNMTDCGTFTECGSVACIGGWAAFFLGRKNTISYVSSAKGARGRLYYPRYDHPVQARNITVEQAAIALRNYLTFGEPCWGEVLAAHC
jgi:hypothetical protein